MEVTLASRSPRARARCSRWSAALALWVAFRRLRAAQQVLLPDGATAGLVDRQAQPAARA